MSQRSERHSAVLGYQNHHVEAPTAIKNLWIIQVTMPWTLAKRKTAKL